MKVTLSTYNIGTLVGTFIGGNGQIALQTAGAWDPAAGVGVCFRFFFTSPYGKVKSPQLDRLLNDAASSTVAKARQTYFNAAAELIARNAWGPFLLFALDGENAVVRNAGAPGLSTPLAVVSVDLTILWQYGYNNNKSPATRIGRASCHPRHPARQAAPALRAPQASAGAWLATPGRSRSRSADAGHQPVATKSSWLAPTAAGSSANQWLTPAASAVPARVKVPARRNRTRLLGHPDEPASGSAVVGQDLRPARVGVILRRYHTPRGISDAHRRTEAAALGDARLEIRHAGHKTLVVVTGPT